MAFSAAVWAGAGSERLTSFAFRDFGSADGLKLVQAARRAGGVLRLTPATPQVAGAAWFHRRQTVSTGFETSFDFRLSAQGGLGRGADGFAFVLQNNGASAVAGRGSAGGFALGDGHGDPRVPGIPRSIAVFFDTYRNREAGDPSGNYIAICTNGPMGEMRWPPPRLAYTRHLKMKLKDGNVHHVRIFYKPPILSVFVDNAAPVLSSTVDLATVAEKAGTAFVGFTASTGSGYENHDILNWSFTAGPEPEISSTTSVVSSSISYLQAACLPDRNLCTPDRAIVEQEHAGRYHIVLPANLEWGASIPNAWGGAVLVSNVRGLVCWDPKLGADGCSEAAAEAVSTAADVHLIAPDRKAGSLLARTHSGRTYFSINGRAEAFAGNEGYVEFDVEVRQ